ncbi:TetR/AcrR family transcriptional regulator [Xanthomonas dyei]|uniref:TetR/AcrR family transcriptional regulator n=1 Tax=Xanthomonas dyei TaxID=743699 RepID=UPI001E318D8A|nr:TetR/AcrR family transcriptional regulator [Xanthomonas dyei]MCC4635419.1 TetR/AcrR family transcriptional regulator [Xanthomonas dyei pv. eucalypti]
MARPLSQEKRKALLTSAAELVATLGTGAPTAKIAQAAKVSEGTLFTYFPTKEDLLNQLYLEIESGFAEAILAPYPGGENGRKQLRLLWNRLIDWGLANPTRRKAMRQLKVSDRINATIRNRCEAKFHETHATVERSLSGHADPALMPFYIDTVLFGLTEIVIEAIVINPQDGEKIRNAGFDLFWKGTAA